MKPLVFIGLISYSLYLWHWPLLTFFNEYKDIINISEHTKKTLVTYSLLLISFIFATVTYKLVETPFRKYKPENVKVFFLSDVCGHGHFFVYPAVSFTGPKGFLRGCLRVSIVSTMDMTRCKREVAVRITEPQD